MHVTDKVNVVIQDLFKSLHANVLSNETTRLKTGLLASYCLVLLTTMTHVVKQPNEYKLLQFTFCSRTTIAMINSTLERVNVARHDNVSVMRAMLVSVTAIAGRQVQRHCVNLLLHFQFTQHR